MNDNEYKHVSTGHFGVYQGKSIQVAARRVNLTVQSFLQQESLVLRQLDSFDQEDTTISIS